MSDPSTIIDALTRAGKTLSVAESFTGGAIADALTDVAGSSKVLHGALVAYADETKRRELGVRQGSITVHGAVSTIVAEEMAQGARERFRSDWAVATTGIAGPTGATPAKPLGLSIVAVAGPHTVISDLATHMGDRLSIKRAARDQALRLLGRQLAAEGIL